MTRLPLGTLILTRRGSVGVVVAHSTADVKRVQVRLWDARMRQWQRGRWMDVGALVVVEQAVAEVDAA